MSNGYVIPVDPAELSNRFSYDPQDEGEDEELMVDMEGVEEEFQSLLGAGSYESRVEPLLERIPPREADLIYLYFILKKRQADIAEIFDVTQAAISYRLDRGIKRIKFLLELPPLTKDDFKEVLPEIFKPIDVDILIGMWETTCQSEVAKQLKLTQGRVRHRFFKAVATLKEAAAKDVKYEPYYTVFYSITSAFNVLREVKLPQWQDRGGDKVT